MDFKEIEQQALYLAPFIAKSIDSTHWPQEPDRLSKFQDRINSLLTAQTLEQLATSLDLIYQSLSHNADYMMNWRNASGAYGIEMAYKTYGNPQSFGYLEFPFLLSYIKKATFQISKYVDDPLVHLLSSSSSLDFYKAKELVKVLK